MTPSPAFLAIFKRDMMTIFRSRTSWLPGPIFFIVFLTICAMALGGETARLRPVGPPLIWTAIIFSLLLSSGSVFQQDLEDGTLEQLWLSGAGGLSITSAKACAFFMTAVLPLLVAVPFAGPAFGLPATYTAAILLSLLAAAPGLTAYTIMTAALTAGRSNSNMVAVLITAPFLIPLLIFGIGAVESYAAEGLSAAPFRALSGLSLIGCVVGLPAAAASLKTSLE